MKIAPHVKSHPPMLMLPNHPNYGHGPHIPLTAPGNKNKPRRRPVKSKPSGKRRVKPIRGPAIAHSMKNEVYVPAPSAAIGKNSQTQALLLCKYYLRFQVHLHSTINH